MHLEIDYLLAWNCTHLANPEALRRLTRFAREEGLWLPIICTPQQMVPEKEMNIDG